MRNVLSLDGIWKFCPAFVELEANQKFMESGYDLDSPAETAPAIRGTGWIDKKFDDQGWLEVNVPGSWNIEVRDLWSYEGHGWYRREVDVPLEWASSRVLFHSDGSNYRTVVYVNGREAGAHDGGYLPFDIPIHELLRYGEMNTIAVSVDNLPQPDRVPGGEFDWWNHGGLYRSVSLIATNTVYVDDVAVICELDGGNTMLTMSVSVAGNGSDSDSFNVKALLRDPAMKAVGTCSDDVVLTDGTGAVELSMNVSDAVLWTPENPPLYHLAIELQDHDGEPVDGWSHRIGIRTIEVRGAELLLNGKPLTIKGFNHYEDSPRTGRSVDYALMRKDIALVKSMGANLIRCHFPNSPEMYDLCDEMGVMFISELPMYQWGRPAVKYDSPDALIAAKSQLEELIISQRNHPSVIMWSVSNECMCTPREDTEQYRKLTQMTVSGNIELIELAKNLDSTRPVIEVSNCWPDDPVLEHTDLLAVNMYAGTSTPHVDTLDQLAKTSQARLSELRKAHPDKPILIAEFGGWAIRGLIVDYFPGEIYQAELLKTYWQAFEKEEGVIGGIVWTFADSDVHRRFEWVYELRVSYGVYDIERRPKAAAEMIRSLWTK